MGQDPGAPKVAENKRISCIYRGKMMQPFRSAGESSKHAEGQYSLEAVISSGMRLVTVRPSS